MNRYVMQYTVSDGYTYSFTHTVPIVSELQLEDLPAAFLVAVDENDGDFSFGGQEFASYDFYESSFISGTSTYIEPVFMTIDQWFAE